MRVGIGWRRKVEKKVGIVLVLKEKEQCGGEHLI